ncbi:hypothetical protein GCM10010269_51760 [Streptomyces humidus]|uniref:DUF732 domain-containing protein n=1 Tax=Streptomyces humidus TaxID=52259 RepID=A0A918L5Z0_9ACTN|nr:hypothetical protein [Streptomyces humidus]GGS06531.1 hypothetical protein GCM10010269_51760 [Streptomyces humidus]
MTKTGRPETAFTATLLAALTLLAAGCGTQRAGQDAGDGSPSRAAVTTPGAPADFPCPGESAAPTPTPSAASSGPATAPPDHYAENHGFMVPLPLHGRSRCDGLAAVRRIERVLEPLRERGDFSPQSTRAALTGLGYAAGDVRASQNGPTGVSFLVVARPLCLEGGIDREKTRADAFGGYPDGTDCEPPSGGH